MIKKAKFSNHFLLHFFVLGLGLLTHFMASAQKEIVFSDNFDGSKKEWFTSTEAGFKTKVSNGVYKLEHTTESGNLWTSRPFVYTPYENYSVEAKMTLVDGVDNYGFGFYFVDGRDSRNKIYNYYNITGNGNFIVSIYSDKTQEYLHESGWKLSSALKIGYNVENTIAVVKNGSKVIFKINGEEVYNLTTMEFWGSDVGFVIYNKISIEVDDFVIKQDNMQLRIPGDVDNKMKLINMGPNINSQWNEIMPIISSDGNTLYFDIKDEPNNKGTKINDDIWYSTKNADDSWSPRKNIGIPLNNSTHNFVISVTPDNNNLLLYGRYTEKGEWESEGLSESTKSSTGWSNPKNYSIDDYYTFNNYFEFCLSPDRKVMIASLEREDTYGERDLYVCFLKDDGNWTKPKNMGRAINSFASDFAPYLAADGKTIYFATSGFPGYGGDDIFVSRRLDDSWEKWSEPVNLGPGINSNGGEAYYSVPASGDWAFTSGTSNSLGESDIFMVKPPKSTLPEPVVLIYGKVIDSLTNEPMKVKIRYFDEVTGKELGFANSSPTDGKYVVVLPAGKSYNFEVEKRKYDKENTVFDVRNLKAYKEFEKDYYMAKEGTKKNKTEKEDTSTPKSNHRVRRETVVF